MHVEQISVFLENKSGRLCEVCRALGTAGVNIRALSLADTSDFGILRIIVNDSAKALEVLKSSGFTASRTEVVAVEVPDKPGGLADILDILGREKVNVEYMYAFVERSSNNALLVFRFDENERAMQVLAAGGLKIVDGSRIYAL